jgi:hypothetical protein
MGRDVESYSGSIVPAKPYLDLVPHEYTHVLHVLSMWSVELKRERASSPLKEASADVSNYH